jgi:hypothetical protein
MTSAQLHTTTGSKPIVSGEFSLLSILEETVEVYEKAMSESLSSVASAESNILKQRLANHPDWADKVDSANVSVKDGHMEYTVDHPDAQDLEYGNPMKKVVATGILRSVAKSREYDVNESLMRQLSSRLPSA